MMKTLLLVGGTGFFGKSFIQAFIGGKLEKWGVGKLIIASRNASGFSLNNPTYLRSNINYFDLDAANACNIPASDFVMHFANSSNKASYEKDLSKEIENVEKSMLSFVESIQKSNVNPTHMLYASSGAVYGPTESRIFKESDPTNITDAFTSTKRHYAKAKLTAEHFFCQLEKKHRKLSIARCFSFVGSELPLNTHFVVGNLIQNILNNEALEVKANIPVVRSYLHADDLVLWLMEILLNGTAEGSIFNVGSDDSLEIHDLARELAQHFSFPTALAPYSTKNVDHYIPNIEKARSIGLYPSYSSIEAVVRTVHEMRCRSLRHGI